MLRFPHPRSGRRRTASACCVRVDLNVPMENGKITDATRIERVAPTITRDRRQGRQGHPAGAFRPAEGTRSEGVAEAGRGARSRTSSSGRSPSPTIASARRPRAAVAAMKHGDVLLLENTRFHKGEEKNDPAFVDDARQARRHLRQRRLLGRASRARLDRRARATSFRPTPAAPCRPSSRRWTKALEAPQRPVIAIVGGAKVSTKLDLLENLITKVQALVIGGAMANTFLHAQGSTSASRSPRRTWPTPRGASSPRPRTPAARSSCRWTRSWRSTSRPTRPRTPTASMRCRPTA